MKSLFLILSNVRYFAVAWVFASINILAGTWVLYLPHIKTKFGLNDGQVGFALFFLALGILISIPFISYINTKIGVGRSTKIGIILFALAFNLPLIAPQYWTLCASLLLTGIFSGFTDVSMNALVSTIEQKDKQNFMSAAHGFFSLGGFIGAGIGAFFFTTFSNPMYHMLIASSCIVITNLLLSHQYNHIEEKQNDTIIEDENKLNYLKPMLALAIVAFIIMCNEGAVEHWSNLFLFDVLHVSESQAGLGFIVFSLTMTLGRFLGDGISQKIGAVRIISYGCIIASCAYLLVLYSSFYVSIIGFGILGFGLSVIIPELYRLAGQTKAVKASVGISIVSGIGFIGFLIGPVLLGLISNAINLRMSYVFLLVLVLIAFCITVFRLRKIYKN